MIRDPLTHFDRPSSITRFDVQANPADVYMDIIGGLVQPSRSKAPLSAVGHESASLASQWRHFAADSPELQPPHDIELELASASASSGFDRCFQLPFKFAK